MINSIKHLRQGVKIPRRVKNYASSNWKKVHPKRSQAGREQYTPCMSYCVSEGASAYAFLFQWAEGLPTLLWPGRPQRGGKAEAFPLLSLLSQRRHNPEV